MSTDPSPSATITLNIETFNPIGSGSFCALSSVNATVADGACVNANPLPPYTVRVASGGQPLPLTFQATGPQPTAGGSAIYNVEAVYFSGSGQGSIFGGPQAINPAPNPQPDPSNPVGTSVTVADSPTTARPTGKWNFAVIVKRVVTDPTGAITWVTVGIIDPPIDNEPGR